MSQENVELLAGLTRPGQSERLAFPAEAGFAD